MGWVDPNQFKGHISKYFPASKYVMEALVLRLFLSPTLQRGSKGSWREHGTNMKVLLLEK